MRRSVSKSTWYRPERCRLLTAATCSGLGSAPDYRTRRALLHLSYSCASPFGPAILVTHDPPPASSSHLTRCLWNRVQAIVHLPDAADLKTVRQFALVISGFQKQS